MATELGIALSYMEQPAPGGIAQAFIVGHSFIKSDSVALILGDNIFYGQGLQGLFQTAVAENDGGTIFGYSVKDPERYGVAEFDKEDHLVGLEEKPSKPKSSYAITGLYMYDNDVVEITRNLKPSARGELEITDVNKEYLRRGKLKLIKFGRGVAWLDTGTPEALLESAQYFAAIEHRQGLKVACLEEIAFRMRYIDASKLMELAGKYPGEYGDYLRAISPRVTESLSYHLFFHGAELSTRSFNKGRHQASFPTYHATVSRRPSSNGRLDFHPNSFLTFDVSNQ